MDKLKVGDYITLKDNKYYDYFGYIVLIILDYKTGDKICYCEMFPHEVADDKYQPYHCEIMNDEVVLRYLNPFKSDEIEFFDYDKFKKNGLFEKE